MVTLMKTKAQAKFGDESRWRELQDQVYPPGMPEHVGDMVAFWYPTGRQTPPARSSLSTEGRQPEAQRSRRAHSDEARKDGTVARPFRQILL